MNKSAHRLAVSLILCFVAWFSVISRSRTGVSRTGVCARRSPGAIQAAGEPRKARRDRPGKGGQVLRRLDAVNVDRVQLPNGMQIAEAIAAWRTDPDVLSVEPNYIRHVTSEPNDPYWVNGSLWGLTKIKAKEAWLLTTGSASVVVANIDTGVNYLHPDLAANMWRNPGEIAGNGVDDDNNGYVDDVYGIDTANDDSDPMDDHGHGTHTAGTIGAVGNNGIGVVGVNWNVKILACKSMTRQRQRDGFGCHRMLQLHRGAEEKGREYPSQQQQLGGRTRQRAVSAVTQERDRCRGKRRHPECVCGRQLRHEHRQQAFRSGELRLTEHRVCGRIRFRRTIEPASATTASLRSTSQRLACRFSARPRVVHTER